MDDYERVALEDLHSNLWIISVVVHPDRRAGSTLLTWLPGAKTRPLGATERQLRCLEEAVVYLIESTLAEYQPRRLGTTELATDVDGVTLPVTEMGWALHLIRTAIDQQIPHTFGPLSAAIYTEPVVFGPLAFNLNKPGFPRVGAMIGFSSLPRETPRGHVQPPPLRPLLPGDDAYLPVQVVRRGRLRHAADPAADGERRYAATDLMAGLNEAANQTASLKTATGRHLFYYAQLPGTPLFRPRPGDISTLDLADMASLDNFPTGQASGYWGRSFIRFKTNGLTAFDFISHDEDVGHTISVGPNGRGKTVYSRPDRRCT